MKYLWTKQGYCFNDINPAQKYNGQTIYISIIENNNDEIPLEQWNPIRKNYAVFIKIYSKDLNYPIYIHKKWNEYVKFRLPWQQEEKLNDIKLLSDEKEADDLNGFSNCLKIIRSVKSQGKTLDFVPIVKYAMSFNEHYGQGPYDGNYQSYLPSIGELTFIYKNAKTINCVLNSMSAWPIGTCWETFYEFDNERFMATSSESDDKGIWTLLKVPGLNTYKIDSMFKIEHMFIIFPLFKCLEDL